MSFAPPLPERLEAGVRQWFVEIAEDVAAFGGEARFDVHAGEELEACGGEGVFRDFDHHFVEGGAGGLFGDGVGGDGVDGAIDLRGFILVEGRKAQACGLADADLVDVGRADAD